MVCEMCARSATKKVCPPSCSNYTEKILEESTKYCAFCYNPIFDGQKYVEAPNGEYAHLKCVQRQCQHDESDFEEVLDWLGVEILEEDSNEIYEERYDEMEREKNYFSSFYD